MNPLRSVGARLGLALAVVVAAALILVDLIVVPSLERNLIDAKLHQLSEAAPGIGSQLLNSANYNIDETIQSAADTADARVVYFDPITFHPPRLRVYADSNPVTSADIENDTLAQRAFVEARAVRGTTTEHGIRYAEVAYPVFGGPVVLLRASLHDSLRSINLVRRRLVVAGLIALAASLLVGYLLASLFARRIRRLERAADRIASGDFSEPVVDSGRDELAELAAAFERMRQRLAQLEHARREFIANASHELRTPLFSLGGFLELMADEELDPKTQSEFMTTMREQVDRLTKLATELLDLSRLDAGRLTSSASGSTSSISLTRWRRSSAPSPAPRTTPCQSRTAVRCTLSATRSVPSRSAGFSSRTPSCTRRPEPPCESRSIGATAKRC